MMSRDPHVRPRIRPLIRPMLDQDLVAVDRIAIESRPHAACWTLEQLREMLSTQWLYSAWVAAQDDALVGFLYLRVAGDEAEILNLAVSPARRRCGIATTLLETAWGHVVQRRLSALYLEVRRSNTAARRLYGHAGFREAGVRAGFYADPMEDAIRLVRRRW